MSSWPVPIVGTNSNVEIAVGGPYGILRPDGINPASATYPTAKKVFYLPFTVPELVTINQIKIPNGTAVSGNVDVGIYDEDGNRKVNAGSTVQAGTSAWQVINITDTQLTPGVYYAAITFDNTSATILRWVPGTGGLVPVAALLGVLTETTGSFGLPATATFVTPADAFIPSMVLLAGQTL